MATWIVTNLVQRNYRERSYFPLWLEYASINELNLMYLCGKLTIFSHQLIILMRSSVAG